MPITIRFHASTQVSLKKLGRYELIRVLGKGAMGVVYEARDPNLDRRVAIKTVKVENLSPEAAAEYEARFRTEARSAARLSHPNIVSVYDAGRDGDTAFLVMEYVQGDDLKHHLDRGVRYTLEQSLKMVRDLLAALDYAHRQAIVHRDIKPANLLIEPGGRLKLTDFGVARIQDSGEATRTQGSMVGTLKYMAPEQVQGQKVDARADLFSVGVVLYQLLTDKRPFDGENDFSIIHQIIGHVPPPPTQFNARLPAAIDAVVARALAKDREQRFATARDFAVALQAAIRRAEDQTVVPPADPARRLEPTAATRPGQTTPGTRPGGATTPSLATGTVTQELELVYWKDIKDSADAEELEGFLARFPDGIYADLARRRLRKLGAGGPGTAGEQTVLTGVAAESASAPDLDATRLRESPGPAAGGAPSPTMQRTPAPGPAAVPAPGPAALRAPSPAAVPALAPAALPAPAASAYPPSEPGGAGTPQETRTQPLAYVQSDGGGAVDAGSGAHEDPTMARPPRRAAVEGAVGSSAKSGPPWVGGLSGRAGPTEAPGSTEVPGGAEAVGSAEAGWPGARGGKAAPAAGGQRPVGESASGQPAPPPASTAPGPRAARAESSAAPPSAQAQPPLSGSPVRKAALLAGVGALAVAGAAVVFMFVRGSGGEGGAQVAQVPVPAASQAAPATPASSPQAPPSQDATAAAGAAPMDGSATSATAAVGQAQAPGPGPSPAGGATANPSAQAPEAPRKASAASAPRRPASRPSRTAAPAAEAPAAPAPPAPAPRVEEPPRAAAAPATPSSVEQCRDKVFISRELCLAEQCGKSANRSHALCVKHREEVRLREESKIRQAQ